LQEQCSNNENRGRESGLEIEEGGTISIQEIEKVKVKIAS